MAEKLFALLGAGFWAKYQLAAWGEVAGAQCVAICDPQREKAERLASMFAVPNVYTDTDSLLKEMHPDFVDIVTPVETHAPLTLQVLAQGIPAICQKPLATSLEEAEALVSASREQGVPLFVHENWRWQTPMRALKAALQNSKVGLPFRARLDFISGFDVFTNQPTMRELENLILADMGTHILDAARFFFGEAQTLTCQTHRVHSDIKGEDAATVMMDMHGVTVTCNMAYAGNAIERHRFPETLAFIECEQGSIELDHDFWLRITTTEGTTLRRVPPPRYAWADPAYDVAQSSMVACHTNLLHALRGEGTAETTAVDNLKTLRLVYAAYDSAAERKTIHL